MSSSVEPVREVTGARESGLVYVDLDGTLVRTDLMWESIVALLRRAPWWLLAMPLWVMRGRAYLKYRLAELARPDVDELPLNTELLEYLRERAAGGATLVLATASTERLAQRFASRIGLFKRVLASTETVNLKGEAKARAIAADSGGAAFAYAGDSRADLKVWSQAPEGIVVGTSSGLGKAAAKVTRVVKTFPPQTRGLKAYIKAIRVYQWLKNALVFVPLIAAHAWNRPAVLLAALCSFFAYSLCASSVYLVNDLVDLASDRRHPRKRARPMASGVVPIPHALLLAPLLLAGGITLAAVEGTEHLGIVLLYVACTSAYSFGLKSVIFADVLTLGGLYTLRIIGGAAATRVVPSFWLLAFSMTVFLSLALIKRCSELGTLANIQRLHAEGRDYRVADYGVLQAMGVASGFCAVVIFALFINSDHEAGMYSHPQVLWLLCGTILYWIGRMWIKTARGEMHDDPLLYTARDRTSLAVLALSAVILYAAI